MTALLVLSALSALVTQALRNLGAPPVAGEDTRASGWRLAVAIAPRLRCEWRDSYRRTAAFGLARALDVGDTAAAERCALWIVRPDDAMDAAQRAAPVTHRTDRCTRCGALAIVSSATRLCLECAPPPPPAAVTVPPAPVAAPRKIPAPVSIETFGIERLWRAS